MVSLPVDLPSEGPSPLQVGTGSPKVGLSAFASFAIPIVQALVQQSFNDAAVDRQNQYNSPASQMHRLISAGINPYMVTGSVASQNQSAQRQPAQFNLGSSLAYMQQFNNVRLQGQQIKHQELENELLANQVQFQQETYAKRVQSVALNVLRQSLEADVADGRLSYQTMANTIKQLETEFAEWKYSFSHWDVGSPISDLLEQFGDTNVRSFAQLETLFDLFSSVSRNRDLLFKVNELNPDEKSRLEKSLNMMDEQLNGLKRQNEHNDFIWGKHESMYTGTQILNMLVTFFQILSMIR